MPWDAMGFGLDTTRPLSALPANQVPEMQGFMALHERHTAQSLPYDAVLRLVALQRDVFARWRMGLVGFFVLGLIALSPVVAIGGITALLLFVAYLSYAHPSSWTIYYMEALPVVAMITVLGFLLADDLDETEDATRRRCRQGRESGRNRPRDRVVRRISADYSDGAWQTRQQRSTSPGPMGCRNPPSNSS